MELMICEIRVEVRQHLVRVDRFNDLSSVATESGREPLAAYLTYGIGRATNRSTERCKF